MSGIQTTGGLFTKEIEKDIIKNICSVFRCEEKDVIDLKPVQAGMTNIVLSFFVRGGKFIYRYPGLGSGALVNRGRETIMQKVVDDIGIDTTLVAMDVHDGWKIAKYVEHYDFDYHNLNDMVRAIMLLRQLHDAPSKVRWNFDVVKKAEKIKDEIDSDKYGNFKQFDEIRDRIYRLDQLSKHDGIKLCNIHGDARDVNFLINKDEIYLTDWEYGGYGDPGFDLGSYICGGEHTIDDIDRILFTYYRRIPTPIQKRHCYAYIAITGWFYLHWTMLKESKGQKVGIHKDMWYQYARDFSILALEMYESEE